MRLTLNDIKAGPEQLQRKLFQQPVYKLKANKPNPINNFCLGYVYSETAKYTENHDEKNSLCQQAVAHYEEVIKKWKNGELAFYARYAAAILMQQLDRPWNNIESRLLAAFQALPIRGESIYQIITYYQSKQLWPVAYLFSKFAKEQFFGKTPKGTWGLDTSFYSWKVLNAHIVSCYGLEKIDEATAAYWQLYRLSADQPALFEPSDISSITAQNFLFPRFASYEKNSAEYHLQQ